MQNLFDKASLVMVPSGYDNGKLYNIKPEDKGSAFEFERPTMATRVNSRGLIETMFPEATNLLLQSNQFDTTWDTFNATPTGGQTGYDGSSDAWLLNATGASGSLRQTISQSGVQTFSVYVKKGTADAIEIDCSVTGVSVKVDLSDGSEITSGASTIDTNIESIGSSWYRISVTGSGSATVWRMYVKNADNSAVGSGDNIYIQDAQLESGYFATPYIETTTQTVTRQNQANQPRIDYTSGEGALLLEPARTNLITNSNSYSGNLVYYTVTSGQNSPDGENNATLFVEKTNTASHIINSNGASISGGQTYTYSFFIKYAGKQNIPVNASDGLSGFAANIDILNGVVNSGTAEIQEFEDGWYRVSMTRTTGAGATNATIQMNFGGITGDGTSGFYLFGYQIEQGSYATSYIPTNGQQETRAGEVCDGAGDSTIFNDDEGVLFVDMAALADDGTNRIFGISDGGAFDNSILLRFQSNSNRISAQVRLSGVYQCNINFTVTDATQFNKVAFKYKANDFSLFVDGVERDSDNIGSIVTGLDELGFDFVVSNEFFGKVKALHYFPEALTDEELQRLTSPSADATTFTELANNNGYTIL